MRQWLAPGLLFFLGCGADPAGGAGGGGADAVSSETTSSASGATEGTTTGGAACSDLVLLAPATELAKTPRADPTAEHIAREASGAFVAPDDLYDLVAADLATIRALEPAVASIEARPLGASGVQIDWATPVLDLESYDAWDCLNAAYRMEVRGRSADGDFAHLGADEPCSYDTTALALQYEALPNVAAALGSGGGFDGPDVCLELRGEDRYYVFDDAGGDCPAGCTTHTWYGFRVRPGGEPEVVGVASQGEEDPPSEPDWLVDLAACRERLRF